MIVTKTLEWDMGHRIPNHDSKCRNLHGHRYHMEISLEGNLIKSKGNSSESMVIDFTLIKSIAESEIIVLCDHAFMFYKQDKVIAQFFSQNPDLKAIEVPFIPTAEEISKWIFEKLYAKYTDTFKTGLLLKEIRVWETPTSSALYTSNDFINTKG